MKTIYGILFWVSFFSAVSSCAVRKSEPITGEVVNVSNVHVKNGQVLYNTYCQKCHPAGEAGLNLQLHQSQVLQNGSKFAMV
jgi:cytochrome c5